MAPSRSPRSASSPASRLPTDWRYRVDQRGHLHVTIIDYGLSQRPHPDYREPCVGRNAAYTVAAYLA